MSLILQLTIRYMFANKLGSFSSYASWLAIGGLSIGIAALMLTASIIQGFEEIISDKLSSFEGEARIKHVLGNTINLEEESIDSLINNYRGKLNPYIRGLCMLRSGSSAEGVILEGNEILPKAILNNDFHNLEFGEIVLGNLLAKSLDIKIGDRIFLQSFSSKSMLTNLPDIKPVIVRDIFFSGLQEYDKTLAYVSLDDARNFFGYDTKEVSGLVFSTGSLKPEHESLIINYPYFFETWRERHYLLFEWITLQRWPAYIMFGLISLVGVVNLLAAIAMIIIEKSNHIGILHSQGLSKSRLKMVFMCQGGCIGLIGCIIGGALSLIIIFIQQKYNLFNIPSEVYFMDQIPFAFNYSIFSIMIIIVLILSILLSWWPAKTIFHLSPASVLRYE